MNVFLISYGMYEYDGRLRELIKISNKLGRTQFITRAISKDIKIDKDHHTIIGNGIFGYLKFIFYSIFKGIRAEKIDILFVDNRKAIIPALIIKLIKRPKYIIQDVRELYIIDEVNHISGKVGCILEKYLIKRADIIICANKYRSRIMKDYYELDSYPLVYENIRRLEYSSKLRKKEFEKKYGYYFRKPTIKLVSTSGYSISRTNDKLVNAMVNLGDEFELFLIGDGNEEEIHRINNIIHKNKLENVHLIDKLEMDELKYFLENCHIGIVNYHKEDMNNKYCASGKIYEFIFEGLPVVTTENIPLIDMCNTYRIGIANDNYVEGIKTVTKRYSYYVENVKKYVDILDVDMNNMKLVEEIRSFIKMAN